MARKRGLSTVQQALRLLAYLADHPEGVGAKEVARLLGKSLSSAYALLHSLMEEGFVVKEEGASGSRGKSPSPWSPRPWRRPWRSSTCAPGSGATSPSSPPRGCGSRPGGGRASSTPWGRPCPRSGTPWPWERCSSPSGTSPAPLTPKTPYTLTDPLALEEELKRVRASGLAVEMEEYALGVSGVAVPLLSPEGRLLGALGVKVPSRRFPFAFGRLARALAEVARVSAQVLPEEEAPTPPPALPEPVRVERIDPPRPSAAPPTCPTPGPPTGRASRTPRPSGKASPGVSPGKGPGRRSSAGRTGPGSRAASPTWP